MNKNLDKRVILDVNGRPMERTAPQKQKKKFFIKKGDMLIISAIVTILVSVFLHYQQQQFDIKTNRSILTVEYFFVQDISDMESFSFWISNIERSKGYIETPVLYTQLQYSPNNNSNLGILQIKNTGQNGAKNIIINFNVRKIINYIENVNDPSSKILLDQDQSNITTEIVDLSFGHLEPQETVYIPIYISTNEEKNRILLEYIPNTISYTDTRLQQQYIEIVRPESTNYVKSVVYKGGSGGGEEIERFLDIVNVYKTIDSTITWMGHDALLKYSAFNGVKIKYNSKDFLILQVKDETVIADALKDGYITDQSGKKHDCIVYKGLWFIDDTLVIGLDDHPDKIFLLDMIGYTD